MTTLKTFDDNYGRHAVSFPPHPFDVFRYISGQGVDPTRVADGYVGRHSIESEHDPVVFLDAYRGWTRELPYFDATGDWFASEAVL